MDLKHSETPSGGTLATFPTLPDGRYDLELRQAWVDFFAALPDGARILDIATGNGEVALIAAETAADRGRVWQIDATDLARIDPTRHIADGPAWLRQIRFHAEVANERLPFEAASFDAVSGHFALEYSAIPTTLGEVKRVLKPSGSAQFIIHGADSALLRWARGSLQEGELVLKRTKLFRRLHKLVSMDQVAQGVTDRTAQELRAAIHTLKQARAQAQQAGAGRILGMALDGVQNLLTARKHMSAQSAGLAVDRAEAGLRTSMRRLGELAARGLAEHDMRELEQTAKGAGFTVVERALQTHRGDQVGWRLRLKCA